MNRAKVRPGLALALIVPAVGCDLSSFGPSTPTARFDLQGVVTSASDGYPVEGARVFLDQVGWFTYWGSPPPTDTVVTDSIGRYHLNTRFWCPAIVSVWPPSSYNYFRGSRMECPSLGEVPGKVVNITLTPTQVAATVFD